MVALRGRGRGQRGSLKGERGEAVLLGYPLALHLAFSPYEVGNIHWGQEQLIRLQAQILCAYREKCGGGDTRDGQEQEPTAPVPPLFRPASIFTCISGMSPWYPAFTSPRGGDQVSGQPLLRMGSTNDKSPDPNPQCLPPLVWCRSGQVRGRNRIDELPPMAHGFVRGGGQAACQSSLTRCSPQSWRCVTGHGLEGSHLAADSGGIGHWHPGN